MYERFVAKKIEIKYIINSKVEQDDKNRFITVGGEKISRVRLMGTVVQKFVSQDNTYSFVVIDDGTETIRIRAFEDQTKDIVKLKEGDIVETVGRVRDYNGETYIIPDFVKVVKDPNNQITRNLELIKMYKNVKFEAMSEPEFKEQTKFELPAIEQEEEPIKFIPKIKEEIPEENISIEEEKVEEKVEAAPALNSVQKAKNVIGELDLGYGVTPNQVSEVMKISENESYELIKNLMKDGDVFEPKSGKFKILD